MRSRTGIKNLGVPLPTLLSQALVAFVIELDNEFEERMPHWTTDFGGLKGSPWLTSAAMYSNCLAWLPDEGVSIRELERRARTHTILEGMRRWGYITVRPDGLKGKASEPQSKWVIRATLAGKMAAGIWAPLFAEIEQRWRGRFGEGTVEGLRGGLWEMARQSDWELPDCMPIVGYGQFSCDPDKAPGKVAQGAQGDGAGLSLATLLARVLLMFAIEFESEMKLSLAICANVLRVTEDAGVPVRELPALTALAMAAVAVSVGYLERHGLAVVETDPKAGKQVRLKAAGLVAQEASRKLSRGIETRWADRFGAEGLGALRKGLESMVGDGTAEGSPLFEGLKPHEGGWRAQTPMPRTLPHFPVVSHRGGYPDGS
jgi:hypothetical protein